MFVISSMLWLLINQAAVTPPKPQPSPVLQVGIFSDGPDGKSQAAAYETSLATESFQYVAGCAIGGGNRPVPDRATDAWRVSGRVERITTEEAVVRVDWQRIRAGGTPVTSPGGSVQLTLHPEDRVLLDSANPDPTAGCGARTIAFEARFGARPGWMAVPGLGPLKESPGVTIGRGGGIASGAGSGTGVGARAGGGGGRVAALPRVAGESVEFSADVWLVRTDTSRAPEKPEFNLQGLVLQKVRGTVPFAFTPFTIETPAGPIGVQITGSVQVTTERGPAELVFTAIRDVKYATGDTNRDSTRSSTGSSTTRNPMPGPEEVLSFEMPPIRVPNSTATLPEQYSVRVRVR
jgi:hypothetical protein